MGLDMYLYRLPKDSAAQADVIKWDEHIDSYNGYPNWLEERNEIHYWRKFNALHHWMVECVQNGVDECNAHLVTREKLEELHSTLLRVNEGNADVVFPCSAGFFFGSTEYDDIYFTRVAETVLVVEHLLNTFDFETESIYYVSSW